MAAGRTQTERTRRYRAKVHEQARRVPALEARIVELEKKLVARAEIAATPVDETNAKLIARIAEQDKRIAEQNERIDELEWIPSAPIGDYVTHHVALTGIDYSLERMRAKNQATIDRIAASMKEVGQLQPIIVQPNNERGENVGFMLIAGFHRLQAAKKLKWEAIRCHVYRGLDALMAEEIELREKLDRGYLTSTEVDVHTGRLAEIMEMRAKIPKKPVVKRSTSAPLVKQAKAASKPSRVS